MKARYHLPYIGEDIEFDSDHETDPANLLEIAQMQARCHMFGRTASSDIDNATTYFRGKLVAGISRYAHEDDRALWL